MQVYRVYYATEYTERKFDRDIFVVVEAANRIAALRKAFDLRPQAILWGMIEESPMYLELTPEAETPHSAPKQAQIEVSEPIQVSGWGKQSKRAKKDDTVLMRHPRGIAQLPQKIVGFAGDFAIIEHPVLKHRLYRKVEWTEKYGWVA